MLTGAGILILELYNSNIVVTLFGMNATNYSDLGGHIDPGETPQDAAYREGREESENLINIKPHELLQYGIPIIFKQYLCYIIYVQNLSFQDYAHNVNIIHSGCQGHYANVWKESNSMARIPLNNIISSAQNSLNYAYDVTGGMVYIRGRTMGIIRNSINTLLGIANTQPLQLYKHLVTTSRMPCLIGTYTYTLSPQSHYNLPQMQHTQQNPHQMQQNPHQISNIEYAIYATPNLTISSNKYFHKCNKTWGGMHITLTGYHLNQPSPKKFLKHISSIGTKPWKINTKTIKIKHNKIYIKSKTLDTIADFLFNHNFQRVKGPVHVHTKWHITSECKIPTNIKELLKNQTWSLVLVSRQNGIIQWLDKYPLNII